jgi:putative ABC transport system permease protein
LGRTFQPGEDSPSAPDLVVISTSLWQRRFHGDRDVIGRVIEVEGSPATIVGVVSNSVAFPRAECELWQNMRLKFTRRGPFFYRGIGRLRPGVTLAQAQAETNLIGHSIEQANPNNYSRLTMPVESLRNYLVGDLRPALLMMFGAVALVLIIATVNIANLLLARATTRVREMAVRLSLGAGRRRLIQQLLTESVLLSLIGAIAGLVLALALLRVFHAFKPANLPLLYQVRLDWTVVLFTLLVSIAAGILFGLAPALHSARGDLHATANSGGRSGYTTARHHRARSILVSAEMALSLVLLVGAGLLLRSFVLLQHADVGTTAPPANVLTMVIAPKTLRTGENRIANAQAVDRFYQNVLDRVSHLPSVEVAGISDSLPPDAEGESDTFSILGQPWSDQAFPSTTIARVSPDYFRSLGVPLLRGRFFNDADTGTSAPVVIISASLAKRYFPDAAPIGQKIRASGPTNTDPYMDIVGVVGDLKYSGPEEEFKPAYYVPYTQNISPTTFLVVRSSRDASGLAPVISNEIRTIDKDAVVRRTMSLEEALSESVAQPRFRTMVVAGFGTLALILAAIGIYGVIAYSVTQRTQEIGIRMALGAQRGNVLGMVISNGMTLAMAGVAIGLAVSVAAARVMRGFLFMITPRDPLVLAGGCALLLTVALAATLIPAIRATRIDPQAALRHE